MSILVNKDTKILVQGLTFGRLVRATLRSDA